MKKIIIIGATSAIAKECIRIWINNGPTDITLVVRNIENAKPLLADLQVRSPESRFQLLLGEFMSPVLIHNLAVNISSKGALDIVLIAHGALPEQEQCQQDMLLCKETIDINGVSPCLFAEAFANVMQNQTKGTIAVIGSIAGDRARKSNYVYGAAKGLVAKYIQGMQHRFASKNLKIILIKPGPTATPMTEKLRTKSDSRHQKFVSVNIVAQDIVDGIEKGKAIIYSPHKWQIVMCIIQHIPSFIFNKLNI